MANKNRSFLLLPGIYEIRLSQKQTGTIILEGSVEASDKEQNYKFKISQAWELNKDEISDSDSDRKPETLDAMKPPSVRTQGGFLEGFRESRMGMYGACQIFSRPTVLHMSHGRGN